MQGAVSPGGDLQAIHADRGDRALLKTAGVGRNARVLDANDEDTFLAAAKTRQWIREESVGMLA